MEPMNKGILHGAIIFSAMIITYYGIRSMHQPAEAPASIATAVDFEGKIENRELAVENRIALNKKLLTSYQNEARDLQNLGLSQESKPVQFAQKKAREAAALIANLEHQVRATE